MMDETTGEMKPITEEKAKEMVKDAVQKDAVQADRLFRVGDILRMRNWLFRVRKITRKDLVIRPLKKSEIEKLKEESK